MSSDEFFEGLAPDLVDEGVLTAADLEAVEDDDRAPQLYDPEDPLGPDTEAAMVGQLGSDISGAVPAEEAAMRIEEDPAGINYDETPGYLD